MLPFFLFGQVLVAKIKGGGVVFWVRGRCFRWFFFLGGGGGVGFYRGGVWVFWVGWGGDRPLHDSSRLRYLILGAFFNVLIRL